MTILAVNIVLIFFLQWVFSHLNKKNYLRVMWKREKWTMSSGHFINIIMPLTLLWSFIVLQAGVRNFNTKLNAVCYIFLFFLGLFFPIYYFFELLQQREAELIHERDRRRRERQKKNVAITYQSKVPEPEDDQE